MNFLAINNLEGDYTKKFNKNEEKMEGKMEKSETSYFKSVSVTFSLHFNRVAHIYANFTLPDGNLLQQTAVRSQALPSHCSA